MKNTHVIFLTIFMACFLNACEKSSTSIATYLNFSLDIDFKDQQGKSLFADNRLHADNNDVEVNYIIDGVSVNFYSANDARAHDLVPFIFFDSQDKKLIHLFLNNYLTSNKSTTIIKLKGFPADTIYAEFNRGENYISLNKGTINGESSFLNGDVVTIVK